jgi:peptidoglycan/xylan/chitin deacetylase (PgdA/CDA1 family)
MQRAIDVHRRLTGERPLGWYTGRTSPNTRRLVVEDGGFIYDADDYNDELPWYDTRHGKPQLVVPYTLDANDMRFATAQGFHSGDQFYTYLKDTFDTLYAEGRHTPRMMSVGLHCRLIGRPGRFASLARFLKYVQRKSKVWYARRIDIARHWLKTHPYQAS